MVARFGEPARDTHPLNSRFLRIAALTAKKLAARASIRPTNASESALSHPGDSLG
jgi:hypothetical protein